ncbi:MAG: hypothetical protein K6L76_11595 [Agarilytica sp.]
MKKIFTYTSLITALILTTGCRDVTENDLDGTTGSQESDPAVVDKPVAYIQRPVPIGFIDDDDVQANILPDNVLNPAESRAGAVLVLKDRASVSAASRVITEGVFPLDDGEEPLYDVRDLSTNEDGTKLVFSMRAPLDPGMDDDDPAQPTWNIWEYDVENDELTRAIDSDLQAERGHDRHPTYMPDDSIVFSSTRQTSSRALMGSFNRPQYNYVTEGDDEMYAFTLHSIDEDRLEITQISFGKGHDLQPTLLRDGRILFLRWDDTSNRNDDRLSLYTMNPNGSNLSVYYGFHSPSSSGDNDQGALTKPRQMPSPDDRILVNYRARETSILGGDIVAIDSENYIDLTQPTSANTGGTGPAEDSVSVGEVIIEAQSPHGYFNSAYALDDGTNRLLVSWMPCLVQGYRLDIYVERVDTDIVNADDEIIGVDTRYLLIDVDGNYVDENGDRIATGGDPVEAPFEDLVSLPCTSGTFGNEEIEPAEPQFGIWIYDLDAQTQSPVVLATDVGTMYTDAVVIEPRTPADIINNTDNAELRSELVDEQAGILHIRSVYDFDGVDTTAGGIAAMADPVATAPDSRPVRFVRFWEEASMPHEDDYEIEDDAVEGRFNNPGRSIIGYAEVHPDGSVMAKVPANTAFSMEYVDANGRRLTGQYSQRHNNWINVRPGEIRECNGCHTSTSTEPHGRIDAEPESANLGALAAANFLNTQLFDSNGTAYTITPEVGETMAEYYVRIQRLAEADEDPLALSLDLNYTDVWTDPASGATPGTEVSIEFGDPSALGPDNLLTAAPVGLEKCLSDWSFDCRTVIDYPDHIQPIYEVSRTVTVDDGTGSPTTYEDTTCIACHSATDPDGMAQEPAGPEGFQFDFRPVVSPLDDDMILLRGYDEFFAQGDTVLVLNPDTGLLEILLVEARDPDTNEIIYEETAILDIDGNTTFEFIDTTDASTVCAAAGAEVLDNTLEPVVDPDTLLPVACIRFVCTTDEVTMEEVFFDVNGNGNHDREDSCIERQPVFVPAQEDRYLNANGANNGNNQRFFDAFSAGGSHPDSLTPAEIKLFSEWLDIGSQYQNEIFKALVD